MATTIIENTAHPCKAWCVQAGVVLQVVTFSKEKMKNKKSGILAFECSQDNYEPLVMHFWERYDGNRSMGLHNTTDEYSNFMKRVSTIPSCATYQQ